MLLLSIFIFREGAVRMFHPWTGKLPPSALQRKSRKFDCNSRLKQLGCAEYWFLSCIYSITVLGNVKYLKKDGKVDIFKTVWHDWKSSYLSQCLPATQNCFVFTVLFSIDVISLKCGRCMSLKYQFFSLTPDAVSCGPGSLAILIDPYTFAPLFTNKAVGKGDK